MYTNKRITTVTEKLATEKVLMCGLGFTLEMLKQRQNVCEIEI